VERLLVHIFSTGSPTWPSPILVGR